MAYNRGLVIVQFCCGSLPSSIPQVCFLPAMIKLGFHLHPLRVSSRSCYFRTRPWPCIHQVLEPIFAQRKVQHRAQFACSQISSPVCQGFLYVTSHNSARSLRNHLDALSKVFHGFLREKILPIFHFLSDSQRHVSCLLHKHFIIGLSKPHFRV